MRPIAVALLLLATGPLHADLLIVSPLMKLGEVRANVRHEQKVDLENRGTTAIELLELRGSCGCIAARWQSKTLEANAKGSFVVELRPSGLVDGSHAWNAQLLYRDGGVLRSQPLTIQATIRSEVTIQPPSLAMDVSTVLERDIIIEDRRARPFVVKNVVSAPKGIRVEVIRDGDRKTRVHIVADAKDLPAQQQDMNLVIATDDAEYGLLEVPIRVVKRVTTRVRAIPDVAELRVMAPMSVTNIRLRGSGEAVRVERVESKHPGVRVHWQTGPGQDATVRVEATRAELPERLGATTVEIHLHGGATIAVPVVLSWEGR